MIPICCALADAMLPKASTGPDNDTVRVSLGRPEPLPGVGLALASTDKPATTAGSTSQWKADKDAPASDTVANLSSKRNRPGVRETEPARPAQDEQRSAANVDWKAILTRAESKP